jgi:hypothetical protein
MATSIVWMQMTSRNPIFGVGSLVYISVTITSPYVNYWILSFLVGKPFFGAEGSCFTSHAIYSLCKNVLFNRIIAEYLYQGPSRFEL